MAAKSRLFAPRTPKLLLPVLLSALSNPQNPSSSYILKLSSTKLIHFLQKHHQHHSSSSPFFHQTHINTILALLPLMISHSKITGTVAKIIGSLSLLSIELNEMIADDEDILKGLCLKIVSCENWVLKKALINALLDVSVTLLGRQKLVQIGGLHYVMLGFLQVMKSIASSTSVMVMKKDDDLCLAVEHSQDELPTLLLSAVVTLTNFCSPEQLQNIPRNLREASIPYFREIWSTVRSQMLAPNDRNNSRGKAWYFSSMTVHNLAESIFRLSIYGPDPVLIMPSDAVAGYIFGPEITGFKNFMSAHWESSSFLLRRYPKDIDSAQDIFSSFLHPLASEESVPTFFSSLLRGMVSCPPVALDEIDILKFLTDVKDILGCPVRYQQDIRVVKTNLQSSTEKHYFQESLSQSFKVPGVFCVSDILNCEEAFQEGYTVAIRGLQYRCKSIAAITQVIAALFGQPSVGANLYVTPPDSQGLACHCDDHCVFVCQLRGTKQWTVFSQPVVQLPRLYQHSVVQKESLKESRQTILREGDVLYIPRGFAHEARTSLDPNTSCKTSEFSAHLTLAIEVEPSFEWEGFAHVALHQWSHGIRSDNFDSETSTMSQAVLVNVLHVAIKLISHVEPLFRKACMVAASSFPPDTQDWLDINQISVFNQVISKIKDLANFRDSLNFVKTTVQKNEDPFHCLRWLEHLNSKEVRDYKSFDSTSAEICKIASSNYEDKVNAENVFDCMKSKFCSQIIFDDAKENFKTLHKLYKESRLQYMNGMLSLHH